MEDSLIPVKRVTSLCLRRFVYVVMFLDYVATLNCGFELYAS